MGNFVSSCGSATPAQEIAVKVNNGKVNNGKKVNTTAQGQVNTPVQTQAQGQVNTPVQTQAQGQVNTPVQTQAQGQVNTPVQTTAQAQANTTATLANTTPVTLEEEPKPSKGIKFRNNALENIKQIKNINTQLKQKKPISTGTPATSILKPNTRTNEQKIEDTSANPEDVLEQSIQRALESKSTRNLNTFMKKKQVSDISQLTNEQKKELVESAKKDEREIRQNGGKRKTRRRRA